MRPRVTASHFDLCCMKMVIENISKTRKKSGDLKELGPIEYTKC